MRRSTAKTLLALALTGAGSAVVVNFRATDSAVVDSTDGATPTAIAGTTGVAGGTSGSESGGAAGSSPTTPAAEASPSATSPSAAATLADGTYTGAAVSEPWGDFQVQAVVSGGQLVDVVVVAAPQDRHSTRINGVAVPILTESAIASQSAAVDLVSGATWTTESYATSLQAALDQAKAAAVAAG